jgi:5-methylcytosine-specific restriction endonuclease McrA
MKKRGSGGRPRGRGRRGKPSNPYAKQQPQHHTSHPTTRNAFVATREWLLEQHGPICAYCGTKHQARTMTLDHVAPRRGQTAYDRRDNLVLACKSCNQKKRDLAPLAFLLGSKERAINLLKVGAHLSVGLLDLARSIVPELERPRGRHKRHVFDPDDSPYRE